jgi:hypothetical protein
MQLSNFSSERLDDLQAQISRNACMVERGRFLMQSVSETGAKGMSVKGLIRVAEMFADDKVVTETWFLQAMNARRLRPNGVLFFSE